MFFESVHEPDARNKLDKREGFPDKSKNEIVPDLVDLFGTEVLEVAVEGTAVLVGRILPLGFDSLFEEKQSVECFLLRVCLTGSKLASVVVDVVVEEETRSGIGSVFPEESELGERGEFEDGVVAVDVVRRVALGS